MQKIKVHPLIIFNSLIEEVTKDDRMEGPVRRRRGVKELNKEDLVMSKGPGSLLSYHDVGQFYKQTRGEAKL